MIILKTITIKNIYYGAKEKQTDYLVINEKVQYGKRINHFIFLDNLFNKLNKKRYSIVLQMGQLV